ncbi:hypothetical protein ACLOJK_031608 [Asimina triloba]
MAQSGQYLSSVAIGRYKWYQRRTPTVQERECVQRERWSPRGVDFDIPHCPGEEGIPDEKHSSAEKQSAGSEASIKEPRVGQGSSGSWPGMGQTMNAFDFSPLAGLLDV